MKIHPIRGTGLVVTLHVGEEGKRYPMGGCAVEVADEDSCLFLARSKRQRGAIERAFESSGIAFSTHYWPRGYARRLGSVRKSGLHYVVEVPYREWLWRRFEVRILECAETEEAWGFEFAAEVFGIPTRLVAGCSYGKETVFTLYSPFFLDNATEIAEAFVERLCRDL